jgi:drug/metabolite transporter (DMT)-like permease
MLYAGCVLVWSSTWVVIAVGLDDIPPFFGAGIRFFVAGAGALSATALLKRPLRTDFGLSTIVGLLPFAVSYGLIYWSEQYVTSGLAAVLFGVLPLYVALLAALFLPAEPLRARLLVGVGIALVGLVVAFGQSIHLGGEHAALAATAVVLSPLGSAIGNVAIKKRAADPLAMNGWAMVTGGLALLVVSLATEHWDDAHWTLTAVGSIAYLAAFGTGFTFVTLTVLLRELPAVTVSFISMVIPFGALALGALFRDERVTALAVLGALLVVAGIAVAQLRLPQLSHAFARRARRPQSRRGDSQAPS